MRFDELLARIGPEPPTISHSSTMDEAVCLAAEKKNKALIVPEGVETVGIFTESDLVRTHVKLRGRPLTDVSIHEVMTNKLIVAEAESDID